MGYNYGFGMSFDRSKLLDVLRGLSTLATPADRAIDLMFSPTEILTLPFTSHLSSDPILLSPTMGRVKLEGPLNFPPDRFIDEYLAEIAESGRFTEDAFAGPYRSVGYVDINVRWVEKLSVKFRAATTRMSVLFADSKSIEDVFLGFMRENDGTDFSFDNDPYSPIEYKCRDGSVFTDGDRYGERKKQK